MYFSLYSELGSIKLEGEQRSSRRLGEVIPMPQAVTPASVADAMAQLDAAMDYLTSADWASRPSAVQADALSGFARAEARQTAARTAALAAFDSGNGYRFDGHAGPRPWLAHITRVTKPAAADAVRWLRLLGRHPRIAAALS